MVNDYFKGSEIGVLNADKFAIQNIDPAMLKEEHDLMDRKFWDYKMWHPTVATMYFFHRYQAIAAKVYEREVGTAEAQAFRRRGEKLDLRTQPLATIRAFWKARQRADAIGCTYDVYIRASIRAFRANYRLFATTKGPRKQHMPYAIQMSTDLMVQEAIKDWIDEKVKRFPLPEHADIPHNTNLWFRPEMESWLIEESNKHQFGQSYVKRAREAGIILGTA